MESIHLLLCFSLLVRGDCFLQMQKRHKLPRAAHEIIAVEKPFGPLSMLSKDSTEGDQDSGVRYMLHIEGRPHLLHLMKTRDLLAETYSESHYLADGSTVTKTRHHLDHCCYTGFVVGVEDSSVSLCTCHGLSGYITVGDQDYTIDPVRAGSKKHRVSRSQHTRTIRQLLPSSVNLVTHNSNFSIELYLVADREEFLQNDGDLKKTQDRLITLAHHVNQIYQTQLNIQIFLVGIEVWTIANKVGSSEDTAEALVNFMQWRMKELVPRKHHDNAQLVSGVPFQRSLGQAYISEMCSNERSGGVVKDYQGSITEVAKYIAHELGHNLGMYHDEPNCHCPVSSGSCLLVKEFMSTINPIFSDCSKEYLNYFLKQFNVSCLKDRPDLSMNITVALVKDSTSMNYKPGVIASAALFILAVGGLVLFVFLGREREDNETFRTDHISVYLLPPNIVSSKGLEVR